MNLHADLVALATRWLKAQGCEVVLAEPWTPQGERPDAIGWRRDQAGSILVEAKATRRDLQKEWSLNDRDRKPFRYKNGIGLERYYIAPPGVVPDSLLLESGWGLLIPTNSGILRANSSKTFETNLQIELQILVRAVVNPQYGKQRPAQVDLPFSRR